MALSNIYQSLVSRNVESKFLIPKLNFITKLTMLVEDGDIRIQCLMWPQSQCLYKGIVYQLQNENYSRCPHQDISRSPDYYLCLQST